MFKKYRNFLNKFTKNSLRSNYMYNKKIFNQLKNVLLSDISHNKKINAIINSSIKTNPELSRLLSHVIINNYYKTNKLETNYDKFLGGKETYIDRNLKSEKRNGNISILVILCSVLFVFISLIGHGIFSYIYLSVLLSFVTILGIVFTVGIMAQIYSSIMQIILYIRNEKESKKLMKTLNIDKPNNTFKFLMILMTLNKYNKIKMKEIEGLLAQFSGFDSMPEIEQKVLIKEAKENIDKLKEKVLVELNK